MLARVARLDILKGGPSRSREGLKVWGPVIALTLLGFLVALRFVGPAPPKTIVLATGSPDGAYQAFGERFREELKAAGIQVELRASRGSVENLDLLRSGDADVAFVQGGVLGAERANELEGIASLYFEPLWVFARSDLEFEHLSQLRGRRIAVGESGSGTHAIAMQLLAANGVRASAETSLFELSTDDATARLLAGRLDALFLVISPTSPTVAKLLEDDGVRLVGIERHLAYERAFPTLSHVVLPEGVLDFEHDIPARDVDLIAPAATLLAREDLHPAIVPLLIEAAEHTHGGGTVLSAPGRFPSPRNLDAPLATPAKIYFERGKSFLYRILPFPFAAMIDPLKILLLPFLTLLLPLFRFAIPLYRWRIRSRIYRWYQALDRLETRFDSDPANLESCLADLDLVDHEIREQVNVPASYMEELYNLRMHMERLHERLVEEGGSRVGGEPKSC
ncbi:MAG TPA: TAXI family TRAP transporter solute-binding subunit [Planctomycetes bacterium]|nr:TAXI family TRAP transporter solute-binding subunit [Planctomycetota bacterium]